MTRAAGEARKTVPDGEIGRYRVLLENAKVRSRYEAQSLRSRLSADAHVRELGSLLEKIGLGPNEVARVAHDKPNRLRDLLVKYAAGQKRAGRLDTYIL